MATISASTSRGLRASSTRIPFTSTTRFSGARCSKVHSYVRLNQRPALQRGVHRPQALGGGGSDDSQQSDKKFITREEEPDQYWVSKGEEKGANPMKDPLAIIGVLAIFFPFGLLLLAIAAGLIDTSVYRY